LIDNKATKRKGRRSRGTEREPREGGKIEERGGELVGLMRQLN